MSRATRSSWTSRPASTHVEAAPGVSDGNRAAGEGPRSHTGHSANLFVTGSFGVAADEPAAPRGARESGSVGRVEHSRRNVTRVTVEARAAPRRTAAEEQATLLAEIEASRTLASVRSDLEKRPSPGESVRCPVDPAKVDVFDAATGGAIAR
jgi:hypothetical protein